MVKMIRFALYFTARKSEQNITCKSWFHDFLIIHIMLIILISHIIYALIKDTHKKSKDAQKFLEEVWLPFGTSSSFQVVVRKSYLNNTQVHPSIKYFFPVTFD